MSRRTSSLSILTITPFTRSPSSKGLIVASMAAIQSSIESPRSFSTITPPAKVEPEVEGAVRVIVPPLPSGRVSSPEEA
jgi:hypothetical protein